jgi:circadian clock protein KaiC
MHLATIHKLIEQFGPGLVVLDPISNFANESTTKDSHAMVTRLVDFLKSRQITAVMTNLSNTTTQSVEQTEIGISSVVDMWLLLRDIESNGERNRGMYVLKARGIAHSNQVREFLLTRHGIELKDVYVGPGGVLTGSSRLAQEARDEAEALARSQDIERRQAELDRRRRALEEKIAALKAEFDSEAQMLEREIVRERARVRQLAADRAEMGRSRKAESDSPDEKAAAREKQR